jgi:hypothetical protein
MSTDSQLLGYATLKETDWHADEPRAFVCRLPCWVPDPTPLRDETGEPIGRIAKHVQTLPNGRCVVRIRLDARTLAERPALREDLLAHRVNIAVEMTPAGRSMVLAPQIDLDRLPAAPTATVRQLFPWLDHVA